MDPQLQSILAELRDVHSPAAVAWWPPAPGWWMLALFLFAGLGALAWFLLRRRALLAYRRETCEGLDQAFAIWRQNGDNRQFLQRCAQLLRQLEIYRHGRREVAPLSGASWGELLSKDQTGLSEASLDALINQQYRKQPDCDPERLYTELHYHFRNLEPAKHA